MEGEQPLGLVAPLQADVEVGDPGATKIYLQKLWAAGIPHVRFVQADAIDWSDQHLASLRSVVDYAESIGMIAGVRLPARVLMQQDATNQRSVIDQLAELGLDYVVVPWAVNKPCHHQVFGSEDLLCLAELIERTDHWEIPVVLESGLIPQTMAGFAEHLEPWIARGIQYVEVFAVASANTDISSGQIAPVEVVPWSVFPACHLRQLACWTEDLADNRNIQITWLPPQAAEMTDSQNSIIEILRGGPRAGGDVCVRIDLEGNMYPPRGPYISIGKIHQLPWSELWNHPCFGRYRDLVCHHDHCQQCTFLTVCATHCPADPDCWAASRRSRVS
jgi:radical SAM protein with 4Fe4S-binding SPASM domain